MANTRVPGWLALFCILLGAFITATAAGFIPAPPDSFNAPRWILGLVGFVLMACGGALGFDEDSPMRAGMAVLILIPMAIMGFWIAFNGDPENISGGLPFLDQTTNGIIGKWVFGIGAVITSGIALIALKDVKKKLNQQRGQ